MWIYLVNIERGNDAFHEWKVRNRNHRVVRDVSKEKTRIKANKNDANANNMFYIKIKLSYRFKEKKRDLCWNNIFVYYVLIVCEKFYTHSKCNTKGVLD